MVRPHRLAVLLSGRGSNFLALHRACESGELPAEIALVVSNQATAPGAARARELGLPVAIVPHAGAASREAHEHDIMKALDAVGAEWVCLAGYMRLLSPGLVGTYPQRILNIHPSLLPAFPGLDSQRQAWDYGVRYSGCTVHLVDTGLDTGPIVDQRVVPVLPGDSPTDLAARILAAEHELYPAALRQLLTQRWEVDGRRVVFRG